MKGDIKDMRNDIKDMKNDLQYINGEITQLKSGLDELITISKLTLKTMTTMDPDNKHRMKEKAERMSPAQ